MKKVDDRKNILFKFGFGTDAMKSVTVCPNCNSPEKSKKMFCSSCGVRLSGKSLYDTYREYHKKCFKCGVVLSDSMEYCPHCGVIVKKRNVL